MLNKEKTDVLQNCYLCGESLNGFYRDLGLAVL